MTLVQGVPGVSGEWSLETKVWVLGVLIVPGLSVFVGALGG